MTDTTSQPQAASREGIVPVLEFTNLSVDFGVEREWVPAAKDLSYAIYPKQVVAVVGEPGGIILQPVQQIGQG